MAKKSKQYTTEQIQKAEQTVWELGGDILSSEGMQKSKHFIQHGDVSVYQHCFSVAVRCVLKAQNKKVDLRSLVRGALLHDYFLYDWHVADSSHRLHGIHHAKTALKNAERDFTLNKIERNMIRSHMFPLGFVLPLYRESRILYFADKYCAVQETLVEKEKRKI